MNKIDQLNLDYEKTQKAFEAYKKKVTEEKMGILTIKVHTNVKEINNCADCPFCYYSDETMEGEYAGWATASCSFSGDILGDTRVKEPEDPDYGWDDRKGDHCPLVSVTYEEDKE